MDVEHELVELSAASKIGTQNGEVSQLTADISHNGDTSALARLGKRQVLKVCRYFGIPRVIGLMRDTSTSATLDSCQ